jgi:hypothetical protein
MLVGFHLTKDTNVKLYECVSLCGKSCSDLKKNEILLRVVDKIVQSNYFDGDTNKYSINLRNEREFTCKVCLDIFDKSNKNV